MRLATRSPLIMYGWKSLSIHLPLSLNLDIKDNLTSVLKYQTYAGKDGVPLDKGCRILNPQKYQIAYSNLRVFEDKQRHGRHTGGGKDSENIRGFLCYRRLILDFLFDLEHSEIFKHSPLYDEIEVKLLENKYFNLIAAKASYYYDRQVYLDTRYDWQSRKITARRLADSEKHYLFLLRRQETVDLLVGSKGWFSNVEIEHERVLFNKKDGFRRTQWRQHLEQVVPEMESRENNSHLLRNSARWFIRRYSFLSSFRSLQQATRFRGWFLLLCIIAVVGLFAIALREIPETFSVPVALAVPVDFTFKLTYWLVHAVAIIGVLVILALFRCSRHYPQAIGMLMPRLIMAISSAWIIFSTTEELWKTGFDLNLLGIHTIWIVLICAAILLFMSVEIRNMAPDIKRKRIWWRISGIFAIGLIYSVILGVFFTNVAAPKMLVRSGYLEEFFELDVLDSTKYQYCCIDTSIESGTCVRRYRDIPQAFSVAEPDSQYLALQAVEVKNTPPLEMVSCNIPVLQRIPLFGSDFHLHIFPGMLLFRAFFALFVGIFIQLVFEDKPITEPL